jgi:hypothetical protein
LAGGGGGGGAAAVTNFSFSVSPRWRLYMKMNYKRRCTINNSKLTYILIQILFRTVTIMDYNHRSRSVITRIKMTDTVEHPTQLSRVHSSTNKRNSAVVRCQYQFNHRSSMYTEAVQDMYEV